MGISSSIFCYTITICDTIFALLCHSQGLTKDGQTLQDLEAWVRYPKSLVVFQSLMRGEVFFSLSVFRHKSFPFQWCINFCRLPYHLGVGGSELEVCAFCLEQMIIPTFLVGMDISRSY